MTTGVGFPYTKCSLIQCWALVMLTTQALAYLQCISASGTCIAFNLLLTPACLYCPDHVSPLPWASLVFAPQADSLMRQLTQKPITAQHRKSSTHHKAATCFSNREHLPRAALPSATAVPTADCAAASALFASDRSASKLLVWAARLRHSRCSRSSSA